MDFSRKSCSCGLPMAKLFFFFFLINTCCQNLMEFFTFAYWPMIIPSIAFMGNIFAITNQNFLIYSQQDYRKSSIEDMYLTFLRGPQSFLASARPFLIIEKWNCILFTANNSCLVSLLVLLNTIFVCPQREFVLFVYFHDTSQWE